jgi:hypothetical protein
LQNTGDLYDPSWVGAGAEEFHRQFLMITPGGKELSGHGDQEYLPDKAASSLV